MKNTYLRLLIICMIPLAGIQAKESKYFQLNEKIPLPDVKGRIDHMAIDLKNNRMFVAALGNNTLEIIDLKIGRKIYTIKGLDEPQGVIFIPENNTIVVSNGGSGKCDIYDANSFKPIRSLRIGPDADNLRYDPNTGSIYVGYGNGAIGAIDNSLLKQIANIALPGHPEAFELEKTGNRIFVNIPPRHIGIINRQSWAVERFIDIKNASENFPMALDEENHRLFVACRRPARLIVFDTQSQTEVYHLDIDKDADDIFWDSSGKSVYVSCGSGFIDVIQPLNANEYKLVQKFPTESGARTCLFVPERGIIYLAVPSQGNHPAEIQVYKTR